VLRAQYGATRGQSWAGARRKWENESVKKFFRQNGIAGGFESFGKRGEIIMLNIISAIISGLIVGALARWIYPGPVPMSWVMTCILGIAGAVAANLVITRGRSTGGLNGAGFLASLVGALALIFIFRVIG
jgi:uncharacterized membrane protein YeaQ/YmgE (transglycosylase-associated protein family)